MQASLYDEKSVKQTAVSQNVDLLKFYQTYLTSWQLL